MKNLKFPVILFAVLASALMVSCGDDDDSLPAKVQPSAEGTFTDSRDGQTYHWVRYGQTDWMTENYRYNAGPGSSSIYLDVADYHDNPTDSTYLPKYGRLYSQAGALMACPDGWRLPTDDDWKQLEGVLGMSSSDAAKIGWRGRISHNMVTLKDDQNALNLLLGGYFTNHTTMAMSGWRFMSTFGYYWTSTQDTSKGDGYYYYRKFYYDSDAVFRESIESENVQLSVRYVRNAQ